MPFRWIYPDIGKDIPIAKALGRELPISYKESVEIAKIIKGMRLKDAIELLNKVVRKETPIPFTRFNGGVGHRKSLSTIYRKWKVQSGRYPVKAAKYILKVLRNAENNAEQKGLDPENLVILHIAAHRGRYIKRYMPRAFGRATPKFRTTTHIEVIVGEKSV